MINKRYFKRSLVSLLTLAALMGSLEPVSAIGSPRNSSQLEDMPDLPFVHICHHLSSKDLGSLRQASKEIKMKVENYDDFYINPLISQLTTFTPVISEDLFHDAVIRSLTDCGFRTRLIAALKKEIEENGFLLDRRGSGLTSLLGKSYTRVSFFDFLNEKERAPILFKTLFHCDLPENSRDPFILRGDFIDQLATCFPVNALYFRGDATNDVKKVFYEKHKDSMLQTIQTLRTDCPYFSYGASDLEKLDKTIPHNIVVRTSDIKDPSAYKDPELSLLLEGNHPHSVIPIQQDGFLSLGANALMPEAHAKLSSEDKDQLYSLDKFLHKHSSLSSSNTNDLIKFTSKKRSFLFGCSFLISCDETGFIKRKQSIEHGLVECCGLDLKDSEIVKVTSLGDHGVLVKCGSLLSLDTKDFIDLKSIAEDFHTELDEQMNKNTEILKVISECAKKQNSKK
jgi:hypothetical protein